MSKKISKKANVFFHDHYVDRADGSGQASDPIRFYTNRIWAIDPEPSQTRPDGALPPNFYLPNPGINFASKSPLSPASVPSWMAEQVLPGGPWQFEQFRAQVFGSFPDSEVQVVVANRDAAIAAQLAAKDALDAVSDAPHTTADKNALKAALEWATAFRSAIDSISATDAPVPRLNWEIRGMQGEPETVNKFGTTIRYDDNPTRPANVTLVNVPEYMRPVAQEYEGLDADPNSNFFFGKYSGYTSLQLGAIKDKIFGKIMPPLTTGDAKMTWHYLEKMDGKPNGASRNWAVMPFELSAKEEAAEWSKTHKLMKVTMDKSKWFYDYNFLYRSYETDITYPNYPWRFGVVHNIHSYSKCHHDASINEANLQMFYENHMQPSHGAGSMGKDANNICQYSANYKTPTNIAIAADTLSNPEVDKIELKEKIDYPFYNAIQFTPQFGVLGQEDPVTRQAPIMLGHMVEGRGFAALTHGAFRQHTNKLIANEKNEIEGYIYESADYKLPHAVKLQSYGDYAGTPPTDMEKAKELKDSQFKSDISLKQYIYGPGDAELKDLSTWQDRRLGFGSIKDFKKSKPDSFNLLSMANRAFASLGISPYVTYGEAKSLGAFARNEIVAYKIVKRAAGALGDGIVSNFYVFPNHEWTGVAQLGLQYNQDGNIVFSAPSMHEYIDTQIKYDEKYSYRLYAVVLVYGKRYRYRNIECKLPSIEYYKEPEGYPDCKWLTKDVKSEEKPILMSGCAGCKKDPKCVWYVDPAGDSTKAGPINLDSAEEAFEKYPLMWSKTHPNKAPGMAKFGEGKWKSESQEFDFSALIEEEPSMRFVEVPLLKPQSWDMTDEDEFDPKNQTVAYSPKPVKTMPPRPPLLHIYPYKGVNDKILILFEKGLGNVIKETTKDERKKFSWEENVPALDPKDTDHLEDEMVMFTGKFKAKNFLLYRTTEMPQSYDDFGTYNKDVPTTNAYKVLNPPAGVNQAKWVSGQEQEAATGKKYMPTGEAWDTAHIIDELKPNQKYYYMARVLGENNEISYSSVVYSVELVDEGGVIMPVVESVEIKDFPDIEKAKRKKSIFFKEKLRIDPSFLQVAPQKNGDLGYEEESTFEHELNQHLSNREEFFNDKVKLPKYKLRITSTKTKRRVDLNITFRKRKITSTSDASYDIILDDGEVVRSGVK